MNSALKVAALIVGALLAHQAHRLAHKADPIGTVLVLHPDLPAILPDPIPAPAPEPAVGMRHGTLTHAALVAAGTVVALTAGLVIGLALMVLPVMLIDAHPLVASALFGTTLLVIALISLNENTLGAGLLPEPQCNCEDLDLNKDYL